MARRGKQDDKPAVTKLGADEIFDALRDPSVDNFFTIDGTLDGKKVTYIASERSNGDVVPLCLILDARAVKTLVAMDQELNERGDAEGGEDDEDEDGAEEGEDESGFEP